jgi:hypothetical protein
MKHANMNVYPQCGPTGLGISIHLVQLRYTACLNLVVLIEVSCLSLDIFEKTQFPTEMRLATDWDRRKHKLSIYVPPEL